MNSSYCNIVQDHCISDIISQNHFVSRKVAEQVFQFFQSCSLFKWKHANNDCEDRANAIAILLDNWKIPNYKAWIFAGSFLNKREGTLVNNWGYHVAAALPVREGTLSILIIDPSISPALQMVDDWAAKVTESGYAYYAIRQSCYYIFPPGKIASDNWFKRCSQNYKWTIQGLAGINGASKTGKAHLCFNKSKIRKTGEAFKELMRNQPSFYPFDKKSESRLDQKLNGAIHEMQLKDLFSKGAKH